MLRSTVAVASQLAASEFVGISAIFSQTIRWKRKPIWLPTAKSKVFRVNPRLRLPEEEAVEILRLYNNYRTYRKTLRAYFIKFAVANQVQFDEAQVLKNEEEDYEMSMALNDEWNKKVAVSREARHALATKKREDIIQANIEAKKERDRKIMEAINEKVRKEKLEAATFITPENIDQAIEEALANVISYEAAIDIDGNRIEGDYNPGPQQSRKRFYNP